MRAMFTVGLAAAAIATAPVLAEAFAPCPGAQALVDPQPEVPCLIESGDPDHPCSLLNGLAAGGGYLSDDDPTECTCDAPDPAFWLAANVDNWLVANPDIWVIAADGEPIDPVAPLPAPLPF